MTSNATAHDPLRVDSLDAPVVVYDTNRDALARRLDSVRAVVGARPVIGTSSRTAAIVLAEHLPAGAVFLVDLFATDFISLDRPGERLIRRLGGNPRASHVAVVAWSAQHSADVVAATRRAGASGYVWASGDVEAEEAALRAAISGAPVWPETPDVAATVADWESWFAGHFDLPWAPWIEPTLVRLASGRDRSTVAEELYALDAAPSAARAAARLRVVAEAIAGEHKNSPAAVAAAAATALSQIAAHRPLAERLSPTISLDQGARALRASPSVVRAAGLTDHDVDLVLEIETMIRAERARTPVGRGAPKGDVIREERLWAAGQIARGRDVAAGSIDTVIDGVLVELAEALAAIDDARQDELYHPEGRAAAALSALPPDAARAIDDVTRTDGGLAWRGLAPMALARDVRQPVPELRAFVSAADQYLLDARDRGVVR